MAVTVHSILLGSVLELIKLAQSKNADPVLWAVQLRSTLNSAAVQLPSTEVANLIVSHICWDNNVPIMWKFLDKAIEFNIVSPLHVIALLSTRVIPNRRLQITAYRLYLELLKRHAFSLAQIKRPYYHEVMRSIDDVLHLSQIFGFQGCEPGLLLVEYVFSLVWQLLDASLDDEGLLELTSEKQSPWLIQSQDMEIDAQEKRTEYHEVMQKINTKMAVELVGEFLQNKVTSRILVLARSNMPSHWEVLIQHLRLLIANSAALRNSNHISPEALLRLTSDTCKVSLCKSEAKSLKELHPHITSEPFMSLSGQWHGAYHSSLSLPIDLYLEDAMEGWQLAASGAVGILTNLVKTLQAVNGNPWHDAFLGLWIASLRLVQRERVSVEMPAPRLDSRLCMLLSITTLAVANIIDEEEGKLIDEMERSPSTQRRDKQISGKLRKDLIISLQQLGDYKSLLTPPLSVTSAANQAAAKAVLFLSGVNVNNGYYESVSTNDMPRNCSGNMRHLIVESCIARNLLDTSAYFWPGYVKGRYNQIPHNVSSQMPSWSSFMKGSPLTPSMASALASRPASSLAETEKIFEIAINGSEDEKISAATILCGASLLRGWNIQEHAVLFIMDLLSPPIPADHSGSDSHLLNYAPLLNHLAIGLSSLDCIHIFSLHGMVPHLASVLMPICEVFGSQVPTVAWTLPTGEELTCHAVFSNAFTLLLRLWRFERSPLEAVRGDLPPVRSEPSPEYLLLIRNSRIASYVKSPNSREIKSRRLSKLLSIPVEPRVIDSFPKLKRWHRQHQECIVSTLSGILRESSVHQTVDNLLNVMFRKMNRGSQQLNPPSSGSSSSPGSLSEGTIDKLKIPAWDILEATPYALYAALAACAHGNLSSRDLVTGLKDLADFLPATLATIVSYFSAEVARGIWKPANMNGTDWPSPATHLSIVEKHIKQLLDATGVDVPSLAVGVSSPATVPLPLAALVSLTITYRLDKASERLLSFAAPALDSVAASCPWPCCPIIASLWSQKVRRWSGYFYFSASRTVFRHNKDAVVQLLRSCFASTLGLTTSKLTSHGGVGALLGDGFGSQFPGVMSPVAPGIFYLRVHRNVRDAVFIAEEVVSLVMQSVKDISRCGLPKEKFETFKQTKYGSRYGQVSLADAMTRIKLIASLGASLVWITKGSSLVQVLLKETLPSWFLSDDDSQLEDSESSSVVATLGGYALSYLALLCGTLAWGVESESSASKRRPVVLRAHMEFLVNGLDGKISLGCNWETLRAYVSGFISLMVRCVPVWVLDINVALLQRLSKGLRQLGEEELALALLEVGGVDAVGAAAELIIERLT